MWDWRGKSYPLIFLASWKQVPYYGPKGAPGNRDAASFVAVWFKQALGLRVPFSMPRAKLVEDAHLTVAQRWPERVRAGRDKGETGEGADLALLDEDTVDTQRVAQQDEEARGHHADAHA